MRKALIIAWALLLAAGAHWLRHDNEREMLGQDVAMTLGFILIVSYLVGSVFPRFKLPMITGYMLAGVLFGPSFFEIFVSGWSLVTHPALEEVGLLNNVALGLIAFTAGGELKIAAIKARWQAYLSITLVQSLVTFVGVSLCLYTLGSFLPGLSELPGKTLLVAVVLLSCTAVANSPATTIAVINETRSAGALTDITLGVTVIKDMVVIGLFAAALSVSHALLAPGVGSAGALLLTVTWEIAGSLILGAILGKFLAVCIEGLGEDLPLALLGVAFLAVYLSEQVHLHGLLICMTAGFVVENFSPHGEEFIHAVERYSLPVYVVFFTLAGAEMDLQALAAVSLAATFLVVARAFFTYAGTWAGAKGVGESSEIRNLSGLGFLGQAGVTLGFAVIISDGFGQLGELLSTIIVAAVALNQFVGPVALRYALVAGGDAGKRIT